MSTNYPSDAVEQARALLEAWKHIDGAPPIGDLTPSTLEAQLVEAAAVFTQIDSLEAQLTDLRNRRDTLRESIWDKVKRVRTGVKGIFGDDSSEYEMVGGTRLSEHKPRSRKKDTG
ncbi:MAG: hypothetical protein JXB30_05380 [Anaerolineae bacterium]|nr:hypothetical protein [Anaerolineae bacterium]